MGKMRLEPKATTSVKTKVTRIGVGGAILMAGLMGVLGIQGTKSEQSTESTETVESVERKQSAETIASAESEESTSSAATAESEESSESNEGSKSSESAESTASALQMSAVMATVENNSGKLSWSTYMEKNSLMFQVESSLDNENFEKLGKVRAYGLGVTHEQQDYEFFDETLIDAQMPRVFYRVRHVGYYGKVTDAKPIEFDLKLDLGLYARIDEIGEEELRIRYAADEDAHFDLRILNSLGEIMESQSLTANLVPKITELDISKWEKGAYFVQLINDESSVLEQIVLP